MDQIADWYKKFEVFISMLYSTDLPMDQSPYHTPNNAFLEYLEFTIKEISYYKQDSNYTDKLKFMKIEEGKITEIKLNKLDITWLPAKIFRGFTNLRKLELIKLPIKVLSSDIFRSLHSLEFLRLDNLEIKNLPNDLLNDLSELKTLIIDEMPLESLPDDFFSYTHNLVSISLYGSDIRYLPESILQLKNLTSLNTSSTLLAREYRKVWTLRELNDFLKKNEPFTKI